MDEFVADKQGNTRQKIPKHMGEFTNITPYGAIWQTIFDSNLAQNTDSW